MLLIRLKNLHQKAVKNILEITSSSGIEEPISHGRHTINPQEGKELRTQARSQQELVYTLIQSLI